MKAEIAAENRASTEELKALVAAIREANATKPISNGWTPVTLLCHIALWDGRAYYTLAEWKRSGNTPSNIPKDATDMVNLAARDVFAAMPPAIAAEFAVKRAVSLDRFLETLDDAFCERVHAAGYERYLRRSMHRRSHMAQIKSALG
jgi:hypothetical protein